MCGAGVTKTVSVSWLLTFYIFTNYSIQGREMLSNPLSTRNQLKNEPNVIGVKVLVFKPFLGIRIQVTFKLSLSVLNSFKTLKGFN